MGETLFSELRASESVLTSAWFESLEDSILLCDESLVVLAANRAAAQLLQMPAGELVGRKADELLAPGSSTRRPLSPVPPARLEWKCEFQAPQGERRTLEVSGVAVRDHITGVEGWVVSMHRVGATGPPPDFIGRSAVTHELLEFVSRRWPVPVGRLRRIWR